MELESVKAIRILKTLQGTKTRTGTVNLFSIHFGDAEMQRKIRELRQFKDEESNEYFDEFISIFEEAIERKQSKLVDFNFASKGIKSRMGSSISSTVYSYRSTTDSSIESYSYRKTDLISPCSVCLEDNFQITLGDYGSCARCIEFICCVDCFNLMNIHNVFICGVCRNEHHIIN